MSDQQQSMLDRDGSQGCMTCGQNKEIYAEDASGYQCYECHQANGGGYSMEELISNSEPASMLGADQ